MATVTLTLQDIIDNGNNATLIAKFVQANGKQELSNFVKEGNIEKIKLLLNYADNINIGINDALIVAVKNKNLEVVKLLLDNEADVNFDNNEALNYSAENRNFEMIKLLVENGADVNSKDGLPLRWAAYKDNIEIAKFLVEKGADVNKYGNNSNSSALRLACNNNNLEMVKFLIEKGAKVNTENNKPLEKAIEKNNIEIVKLLLQHGASFSDNMLNNSTKSEIKDLFKKTTDVYFGIESDTELEIKLPDLIKITKNNKYYYVYKSTISGSGFVVPQMDFKIQILSGFGEMKIFNCL